MYASIHQGTYLRFPLRKFLFTLNLKRCYMGTASIVFPPPPFCLSQPAPRHPPGHCALSKDIADVRIRFDNIKLIQCKSIYMTEGKCSLGGTLMDSPDTSIYLY